MQNKNPRILIVGAGAAGCFCAVQLHKWLPGADIRILEAGPKPLAKLAVTGGGRCNISNTFEGVDSIRSVYPRGEVFMKRGLKEFSSSDALAAFEQMGLSFTVQTDNRIFPASQNAMDVVNAILHALDGIRIECGVMVDDVLAYDADYYVVATGGGKGMELLKNLPVDIEPPVPSLFTFNICDIPDGGRSGITALMGLAVNVRLSIPSSGFSSEGDLLITDWGFSGPAAISLSSYSARYLAGRSYRCPLIVNWVLCDENSVREKLLDAHDSSSKKQIRNFNPFRLPQRLWEYLCIKAGLRPGQVWGELGSKGCNRLASILTADSYFIWGKTRFRDEFVTCGGVSLSSVNLNTLECKHRPRLYFAGEVLDIDAVTGGFNLQAAWTTAYIVSKSIINSI